MPVVRSSVLERHGDDLRDAVNAVSGLLTTEELVGLNRRVDLDGQTPHEAARAWLSLRGMGKPYDDHRALRCKHQAASTSRPRAAPPATSSGRWAPT